MDEETECGSLYYCMDS